MSKEKLNMAMFGEIAVLLQDNLEDEAEASKKYQEVLNKIQGIQRTSYLFTQWCDEKKCDVERETAKADKKMLKLIEDKIKAILVDELNHQRDLQTLYTYITGLKGKSEV